MADIQALIHAAEQLEAAYQSRELEERNEWINMPAKWTADQVKCWRSLYGNRRSKFRFRIVLTALIPDIENHFTWQCWVSLQHQKGLHKVRGREQRFKASALFVKSLIGNKEWREEGRGPGCRFILDLNNPVIEP